MNIILISNLNLKGCIRQIASVFNWYGALFVELARAATSLTAAILGDMTPLQYNTASVINFEGICIIIIIIVICWKFKYDINKFKLI